MSSPWVIPSEVEESALLVFRRLLILPLFALVACSGPVEWSDNRSVAAPSDTVALTPDGRLVFDSTARLSVSTSVLGTHCANSVRMARSGASLVAVWWEPRPDSSVRLLAARSEDSGRTWSSAVPVDTVDKSVNGCRRVAPSVAIDSASGYAHVAYALTAPEGPGLFFSHSMDKGGMFHSPVPITYGEHPANTAVAADGDVVAVAFEDPNGRTARIGLALSRTMGHIFEDRMMPVSDDNGVATRPLVAVRGRRIAVAWREGAADSGATALRVRTGLVH